MDKQINISHLNPLNGTLEITETPLKELGVKNANINIPNMLLIAGNGRNVGKTTLACKIISGFADKTEVVGLKISPHFHNFNEADIVFKNDLIVIVDEKEFNLKDSSLMLQAGAKKVYFVMAKPDHLEEAVEQLIQILPEKLIVCESGGLHKFVKPGLFLMVKRKTEEIVKTHLMQYNPIIVNNDGKNFDFDILQLEYKNHQIKLKN